MTEELKEQIHERVYNIKVPTLGFSRRDLFNIAMEYAEPREKRIAELEKVCQDLSDKFDYQVKQVMKLEDENQRLSNLVASYMTGEEE